MNPYASRNRVLAGMGFATYLEYLASPLWKSIRVDVFKLHGDKCLICKSPWQCVHHLSYGRDVLDGKDLGKLTPLCLECHYKVEFTAAGVKRSFESSQAEYDRLLRGLPAGTDELITVGVKRQNVKAAMSAKSVKDRETTNLAIAQAKEIGVEIKEFERRPWTLKHPLFDGIDRLVTCHSLRELRRRLDLIRKIDAWKFDGGPLPVEDAEYPGVVRLERRLHMCSGCGQLPPEGVYLCLVCARHARQANMQFPLVREFFSPSACFGWNPPRGTKP